MPVDKEFALRSFAHDLLNLAVELDVGAINVYVDPSDHDGYGAFVTGAAWPKHSPVRADEETVVSFSDFLEGEDNA